MRPLYVRLHGPVSRVRLGACLCGILVAGCGATHTAAPHATRTAVISIPTTPATPPSIGGSLAVLVARDQKRLRASSYTPDRYAVSHLPGGAQILIFHTICTGSADGHCQAIQVFRNQDTSPIWVGHYAGVKSFHSSPNGFTVTSIRYAASDPLCCPSLPPATTAYQWNGTTFITSRPGSQVSP